LSEELQRITKELYHAFEAEGYARADIRQDRKTKQLYVLELNLRISLFYKEECTADSILRLSGVKKSELMKLLLDHGFERSRKYL
jgi:hypothetical protein